MSTKQVKEVIHLQSNSFAVKFVVESQFNDDIQWLALSFSIFLVTICTEQLKK